MSTLSIVQNNFAKYHSCFSHKGFRGTKFHLNWYKVQLLMFVLCCYHAHCSYCYLFNFLEISCTSVCVCVWIVKGRFVFPIFAAAPCFSISSFKSLWPHLFDQAEKKVAPKFLFSDIWNGGTSWPASWYSLPHVSLSSFKSLWPDSPFTFQTIHKLLLSSSLWWNKSQSLRITEVEKEKFPIKGQQDSTTIIIYYVCKKH